jgi:hypothetical protein
MAVACFPNSISGCNRLVDLDRLLLTKRRAKCLFERSARLLSNFIDAQSIIPQHAQKFPYEE